MKNNCFFRSAIAAVLLLAIPFAAMALDAGVSYAVYATPDKPYVEINLEIAALTVTYKPVDSLQLQASVEVTILIKRGEEVVNYEKYLLNSPLVTSPRALLDVKRLSVPNGDYTLEVSFQDINTEGNKKAYSFPLKVAVSNAIYLSEIQLLRGFRPDVSTNAFVKNGYFMEPLPFNFYDRSATLLVFYTEMYHTNTAVADGNYTVRYFIEKDMGNGTKNLVSVATKQKTGSTIDAALVQLDISKLESGNYALTVELRNATNELLANRSLNFVRSNPFLSVEGNEITDELLDRQFVKNLDEATLRYSLRAISAVIAADEADLLKNVLKSGDLKQMRFTLFRHFARLDPNNPEQAYTSYIQLANGVHQKFKSGFRYGFETDRGRAFLKYGRPDDMIHVEDDPIAAPYEIWVYNNFPKTGQQKVKFLFYNPSLAGEDFILLHSNARGEISNPRWEIELYKRSDDSEIDGDNKVDATQMKRNVGRNARVYFEDL